MTTATIHRLPGADIYPTFDNVQGAFQLCRQTGQGHMHLKFADGEVDIMIDEQMATYILTHLYVTKELA